MKIEITDLGSWGDAILVAEYDARDDAIRVNARAVAVVRATLGEAEVQRFITVAIAHERYHRENPQASEVAAHAFARATCGVDPAAYEPILHAASDRA